jgi:GAF domain-containing protein
MMRLREQRFGVLVVEVRAGTKADVKRLACVDPEMYLLLAATESDLPHVAPFVREWHADDVVRLPLNRKDVISAVDRASRLGSRVAQCVKLYELCRSLFGTLKQRDLVRMVVDVAPRVIAAESVALFLVSAFCESQAAFECHATESPLPEVRGPLAEVTGLVLKRGVTLTDDDMPEGRTLGVTTYRWLGCPLFGADGPGGAVVFLRRPDAEPFSPHEREAASTFAATVANALENARDYRELQTKVLSLTRESQRAVSREAVTIARDLGGAVAHEITNAMTAVTSNVDALAAAAQDQELWTVAKEAAEYLLLQGEPTGHRLASRIMEAGGGRDADGLVTEIAGMIDECLEGVRRVAEMARGLGAARHLPPPAPRAAFDAGDLLRAPAVTRAVLGRPVLIQGQSTQPFVASQSDVEQAIAHVLRGLDSNSAGAVATPLVMRIEDRDGTCALTIDDPTRSAEGPDLQCLLAPRLRVHSGNVFRLDASFSFAHALLARNDLDMWVEPRTGGGLSFVISKSPAS